MHCNDQDRSPSPGDIGDRQNRALQKLAEELGKLVGQRLYEKSKETQNKNDNVASQTD